MSKSWFFRERETVYGIIIAWLLVFLCFAQVETCQRTGELNNRLDNMSINGGEGRFYSVVTVDMFDKQKKIVTGRHNTKQSAEEELLMLLNELEADSVIIESIKRIDDK